MNNNIFYSSAEEILENSDFLKIILSTLFPPHMGQIRRGSGAELQ